MTGGVVTAFLMALQYCLQKTLSWRFYKWLITVFIVYACFLAWREEYDRAQSFLEEKADLHGQLRELKSNKGSEEHIKAIEKLQAANAQLEAELRLNQQILSALQASLQPRRLTPEARDKFTAVLAFHDGRQFGIIDVDTGPGCQECMSYRDEIGKTINSVPGWKVRRGIELAIEAGWAGLSIGVNDSNAMPPGAHVMADALKAADLPFTIRILKFLSPENFIVIVGNKQ